MTILIDADGCPVVDITIKLAVQHRIDCVILCDTSHVFERAGARTITVPKGAGSVDFALVNMVKPGDIVITQDYGLAAMCLARKAVPISQDGMEYDNDNIDALLLARHTAKKIRMSGGRLKGNTKRTPGQNAMFEKKLTELLSRSGIGYERTKQSGYLPWDAGRRRAQKRSAHRYSDAQPREKDSNQKREPSPRHQGDAARGRSGRQGKSDS